MVGGVETRFGDVAYRVSIIACRSSRIEVSDFNYFLTDRGYVRNVNMLLMLFNPAVLLILEGPKKYLNNMGS